MGCWNGTCALSNLPILAGEEVVLYVLKKNSYTSDFCGGMCNSTDLYAPLPLPIMGKYDEYGLLDPIVTDLTLLEEYFNSEGINSDEKEGVLRDIERGSLQKYSLILMHKELYDSFIDEVGRQPCWYDEGSSLREGLLNKIGKAITSSRKINSTFDTLGVQYYSDELTSFVGIIPRFFRESVLEGNLQSRDGLLEQLLLVEVFSRSRKFFHPQTGAGSQDSYYDSAIRIGDFASKKKIAYNSFD